MTGLIPRSQLEARPQVDNNEVADYSGERQNDFKAPSYFSKFFF